MAEGNGEAISKRGEKRRAAFIEAATDVFLEHGYAAASLDMVIERSGGSRRTLYEQFGDKSGLFSAVVDALLDQIIGRLSQLSMEHDDPEAALRKLGVGFMKTLMSEKLLSAFRMIIAEAQRFPELGARFFEDEPERAFEIISTYLKQCEARGVARFRDPERAARHFLELMKGDLHLRALMQPGHAPTEPEIEAHVDFAVGVFLRGAQEPMA